MLVYHHHRQTLLATLQGLSQLSGVQARPKHWILMFAGGQWPRRTSANAGRWGSLTKVVFRGWRGRSLIKAAARAPRARLLRAQPAPCAGTGQRRQQRQPTGRGR